MAEECRLGGWQLGSHQIYSSSRRGQRLSGNLCRLKTSASLKYCLPLWNGHGKWSIVFGSLHLWSFCVTFEGKNLQARCCRPCQALLGWWPLVWRGTSECFCKWEDPPLRGPSPAEVQGTPAAFSLSIWIMEMDFTWVALILERVQYSWCPFRVPGTAYASCTFQDLRESNSSLTA